MKIATTKQTDIKREWHLVDAKDQVLGRLASNVATLLMGKKKSYYVPYMDCGDFVVVINAQDVKLTGRKEQQKVYTRYSGYPGGLKKTKADRMRKERPMYIVRHAVKGMLPKNKIGDKMIKKLFVYKGEEHPHTEVQKHGSKG
ncbi:MAG TPA: 50S ribosomal protein L13 [Patescibacteria group bacterium]|nr:50S ribosomal protein L13 [Patescibacteria group bacterium]